MRPYGVGSTQRCSVYACALVDTSAAGGALVIWLPNFIFRSTIREVRAARNSLLAAEKLRDWGFGPLPPAGEGAGQFHFSH